MSSIISDIPGHPGYFASGSGDIFSLKSGEWRELKQRIHKGYFHVSIKNYGKQMTIATHRLILLAFKGKPKNKDLVCRHLNGNPLDNTINNLEWGTTSENVQDSIRHGTAVCLRHGERHPASKLTRQDINNILIIVSKGITQTEIAKQFNISQKHVSDIKLGRTWKKDRG